MTFKTLILAGAALTLVACGNNDADVKKVTSETTEAANNVCALRAQEYACPVSICNCSSKWCRVLWRVADSGDWGLLVTLARLLHVWVQALTPFCISSRVSLQSYQQHLTVWHTLLEVTPAQTPVLQVCYQQCHPWHAMCHASKGLCVNIGVIKYKVDQDSFPVMFWLFSWHHCIIKT